MTDRTCVVCGGSMAHRTSPKAIYCSQQCRDWRRHHPGQPLDRSMHKCRNCSKDLRQSRLDLRFCSRRCQERYANGAGNIPNSRLCKACGNPFPVLHGHQVYCTAICRDAAFFDGYYQRNAEKLRVKAREYNRRTGRGTEGVHRYQARKRAGEVEKFTNKEIFERDGGVCQICQDPVDPALKWPERMSPSLDHIVPVSKGGHHIRANVQLAHLTCNISKNDKDLDDALEAFRSRRASNAGLARDRLDTGEPRAS